MLLSITLAFLLQGDVNYKVNPIRVNNDLYKDIYSQLLIETQYCIDVSIGDGILIDGGPLYRKLIFSDHVECIVKAIYKR